MEGIGQMESSFVEGQVMYRRPEIENVSMSAAIGVKALKDILAQMLKNGDALRNSLGLWNLGLKSHGPEDLTFLGRLAMSRLPRRLQWTEEACYT